MRRWHDLVVIGLGVGGASRRAAPSCAARRVRELIYPYPTFLRGVEDALRQP